MKHEKEKNLSGTKYHGFYAGEEEVAFPVLGVGMRKYILLPREKFEVKEFDAETLMLEIKP
jgi:hypothetical protein